MEIYERMRQENFVTRHGDEFITTLAARQIPERVKNAGAYVYRFWTGAFRLVSTCYRYNPVVVLHVPAEKERGMLQLYERFIRRNRIPTERCVHRILHLTYPSLRTRAIQLIRNLKKVL